MLIYTNQLLPQLSGVIPDPVWVGSKWLLGLPWALPSHKPCCPLNDCRRAACSFFEIGCCLFSCSSLSSHSSHNVHPNPGPVFPCSVCTKNVTWRSRSVQCCKCSLLSFSKFRTLGCSHSWSCLLCCIPASSGDITVTSSSDSFSLYTSIV